MKVYGFDDTGAMRGELLAAQVDSIDMRFPGLTRRELGWEYISSRFSDARNELISRMEQGDVDAELIAVARSLKASYILVD